MEKTAIILQNEEEKTLPSRESVLLCLEECRRDLKNKLDHGRFKSPALERERNAKLKILVSVCQVMLSGLRDVEYDQIKERLDRLEREGR